VKRPMPLELFYLIDCFPYLGMGDVLGLIEEIEQKVDKERPINWSKKSRKARALTWKIFVNNCNKCRYGGVSSCWINCPA